MQALCCKPSAAGRQNCIFDDYYKLKGMIRKLLFILLMLVVCAPTGQAQDKDDKGIVFARIYSGFYYSMNNEITPQKGFDFTTGILGYRKNLSENVSAVILYDVTRTTNSPLLDTTAGSFEGSKYTAFLKMAQIDWRFHSKLKLSVGQLLNEQYLTVHDKWWGFRYIDVTFQEKFRFGMPADFGARLTYNPLKNLQLSYTVVNGEGPFRYQNADALFLHSFNLELRMQQGLLLKMYVATEEAPEAEGVADKQIASFFAGYKNEQIMLGFEANFVENYGFIQEAKRSGFSIYGAKPISDKLKALARVDYFDLGAEQAVYQYYLLAGLEYQPVKNFGCAVTYRLNNYQIQDETVPQLNVNFGIKF